MQNTTTRVAVESARADWLAGAEAKAHNTNPGDEYEKDRKEQELYETFVDAAEEAGLCLECLTDLSQWAGWGRAYCPTHSEQSDRENYVA